MTYNSSKIEIKNFSLLVLYWEISFLIGINDPRLRHSNPFHLSFMVIVLMEPNIQLLLMDALFFQFIKYLD